MARKKLTAAQNRAIHAKKQKTPIDTNRYRGGTQTNTEMKTREPKHDTRKFGNRVYSYEASYFYKEDADAATKRFRKNGSIARVVETKDKKKYRLYTALKR